MRLIMKKKDKKYALVFFLLIIFIKWLIYIMREYFDCIDFTLLRFVFNVTFTVGFDIRRW